MTLADKLRKLAEFDEVTKDTDHWGEEEVDGASMLHARLQPLITALIEYFESSPPVYPDDIPLAKIVYRLRTLCDGKDE